MTMEKSVQEYYSPETSICYGCGRNNEHGMHVQTFWNGEEGICRHTPDEKYTAFPGIVYGGTVASLIDCHSIGTAIAAWYQKEGREFDSQPEIRAMTGTLSVKYLRPTPTGVELVLRSKVQEITDRKVTIVTSLFAGDEVCATGEVIAIRVNKAPSL